MSEPNRRTFKATLLAMALTVSLGASAQGRDLKRHLDMPAQPMSQAIQEIARQVNLNILVDPELVAGINAPEMEGGFTVDEAFEKLLAGTGLKHRFLDDKTVMVTPAAVTAPTDGNEQVTEMDAILVTGTNIRGVAPVGSPLHVIDRRDIDRSGYTSASQLIESLPQNFGGDASEDVINTKSGLENIGGGTGVNLRGLNGNSTLVLLNGRRMPQAGGQNGGYVDISNIPLTAIESVQILTDGASAIYGSDAIAGVVNFVLRDAYEGAETTLLYGGTTQGGAREIQLAQTLGYSWGDGSVLFAYEYRDRGNLAYTDRPYSRSADLRRYGGDDWRQNNSNPGTIVYPVIAAIPSNQDGTGLSSADLLLGQENLSDDYVGYADILSGQKSHNAFAVARHSFGNGLEFFAEGRWARRDYSLRSGPVVAYFMAVPDTNPYFVSPDPGANAIYMNYSFADDLGARISSGRVENAGATLGFDRDLARDWRLEVFGAYAREKHRYRSDNTDAASLQEALGFDNPATPFDPRVDGYFNPFGDGSHTSGAVLEFIRGGAFYDITADVFAVNAKADGALFQWPGGTARLAVGAEGRRESYERMGSNISGGMRQVVSAVGADQQRQVSAVFAEFFVPIVGKSNSLQGVDSLELSAAVRYERYDDFGSSSNPKLGLAWRMTPQFTVRGSWGTSFKAPTLETLNPQSQYVYTSSFEDPAAAGGNTFGLFLQNSNPDLKAETSTQWTVGMAFEPTALPGLRIEGTYYSIDFKDRVAAVPGIFSALLDPAFYAPFIIRDPNDALVQQLIDSPGFLGFGSGPPDPSTIDVIIDGRFRNISSTRADGIDWSLGYRHDGRLGRYDFNLNGSYMLSFDEQVLAGAPDTRVLSRLGYPVDLRLRASGALERDGMGVTLAANYLNSYRSLAAPAQRIDSWTTFDANLWVDLRGALAGTRVALSVLNIFDEDPPFVNQLGGYDPANADALGRVVSIQARHQW